MSHRRETPRTSTPAPWARGVLLLVLLSLGPPAGAAGLPEVEIEPRYKVVGYAFGQDLVKDGLNRNNFLELVSYRANLEARPDFFISAGDRLRATFKPRARVGRLWWREGVRDGDEDPEGEAYINEGNATLTLHDSLLLVGGRENLQWGPSYLISASNPFIQDNGRSNPKIEVPGLEYLRAVWIPSYEWTIGAIANLGDGRLGEDQGLGERRSKPEFDPTYALKFDYTGPGWYASAIAARRREEKSLGFFAGLNATDAWMVYAEGQVRNVTHGLQALVGSSYTLENGGILTAELYYNRAGCRETLVACVLGAESSTVLLRRAYLLTQYTQVDLFDTTDVTLRMTHNLDDDSTRWIGIVEHDLNDYAQLFGVANLNGGGKLDEFRALVNYFLMMGVEITY